MIKIYSTIQTFRFIQQNKIPLIATLLSFFLLGGCEELVVENKFEPTINFQEGTIEGVKTGDDTTAVIQKLGRPDWIGLGDFDGFIFKYANRSQPGIEIIMVFFLNTSNGSTPPKYRASGITVLNSYDGKSKEGIGIGAAHSFVINKLGNPNRITEYDEQYYFKISEEQESIVSFLYNENQNIKQIGIWIKSN